MTEEEQLRRRLGELLSGRIDRIRNVIDVYDLGGVSASKALSEIEDIASGEADRIVKVGNQHTPEVET